MGGECQVNPIYDEKRHRRKHAVKRFLILAGTILVVALILLGLITFITWLVLRPVHSPSWVVEDVQVLTLNIQSSSHRRRLMEVVGAKQWGLTSYLLNADLVLTLRSNNRNKHMEIIYDRIEVRVAYATSVFSRASFLGFTQDKHNTTIVETEIKAMSVPVTYILANAIQGNIQSGRIDFEIHVDVRARVKIGDYKSFGFGRKTTCEVTTTTPTSGRVGQLITKKCHKSWSDLYALDLYMSSYG